MNKALYNEYGKDRYIFKLWWEVNHKVLKWRGLISFLTGHVYSVNWIVLNLI